jgi:hypothetical protein
MEVKSVLITNPQFDIYKEPHLYLEDNIQDTTYYAYTPNSVSNSQSTLNYQVPGYQLVLDKTVLISTYINTTKTITSVPIGQTCYQYSQSDCLNCYPFNRILNTASAQVNTVTKTMNSQVLSDEILRTIPAEKLAHLQDLTSTFQDQIWGMYSQGVNTNSNVLASQSNTGYNKFMRPRGAGNFVTFLQIDRYNSGGVFQDNSPVSTATTDYWTVSIQIHTVEPLFGLPPFSYEPCSIEKGGLVGINNINIVFNTDTTLSRMWSTANTTTGASALTSFITSIQMVLNPNAGGTPVVNLTTPGITSSGLANMQLLMTFYSPTSYQLKQMGDLGNHVAYKDYTKFFPYNQVQIASGATTTLQSQSIQLQAIPTRLYIWVRVPVTVSNYWAYTKSYLTISAINLQFNNKGGILSTASQYQLYKLCRKNNSHQTWEEFSGWSVINDAATGGVTRTPSIGSLLVLDPCRDFGITESQSNNSLGQFNLTINSMSVTNQFPFAITPELCILCEYDGDIYYLDGNAQDTVTNVSQDLVFKTKESSHKISDDEFKEMSGGSIQGKIGLVRKFLGKLPQQVAKALGSDVSGGGVSGGSYQQGNRLKNIYH